MDPTDFYYKRRALGLTHEELAQLLTVAPRTVRRWEQGELPIPTGVEEELNHHLATFANRVKTTVDATLAQLQTIKAETGSDNPPQVIELTTFKDAQSHGLAHPGEPWFYHKSLIATIGTALAAHGLRIQFVEATQDPAL